MYRTRVIPIVIALFALLVLPSSLAVIPKASAATNLVLNESTCTGSMLQGTWSWSPPTCTLSSGSATWSSGYVLIIPFGTTLAIINSAMDSAGLINFGTLTNYGRVIISNSGTNTIGLTGSSSSTITNYGTFMISNSGYSDGLINVGALTNHGTILIGNSGGSYGLSNEVTMSNLGTIVIANSGAGYGVFNVGSISNSGRVIISNSASQGLYNRETITNLGLITISNSGGDGLFNFVAMIINDGSIMIGNGAGAAAGFANEAGTIVDHGTMTNYGLFQNTAGSTLTISNSRPLSVGFHNEKGGTASNDYTSIISISNSGFFSFGWLNGYDSTLTNYGTMSVTNCPQTYSAGFVSYPGTVVGTYPSPTC
jgi:hypothetical protein